VPAIWVDGWAALATALQALWLFNVAFLTLATAGAWASRLWPRRSRPVPPGPVTRFGVLIAAHDEAAVIGDAVRHVLAQDYPPEARSVVVVADRCRDATAEIARRAGAEVYERANGRGSKGAALGWLWQELGGATGGWDAVIVLDADNLVQPGFLAALDRTFRSGARVAQGTRVGTHHAGTPASALDALAEALHHRVVARGLDWWGISTTISGSGVGFVRDLFGSLVATTTSQVEDCEWQIRLLCRGERIRAVPEAIVLDEKTGDFATMTRQRARWVQGKLQVAGLALPEALHAALRGRKGGWEAIAHLLTTVPRSVLVAGLGGWGILALLRVPGVWGPGVWAGALALFAAHVATGLVIDGIRGEEWRSLAHAPAFMAMLFVACRRALWGGTLPWERTPHGAARKQGPP
jgi:cellulose synthase/poly-beta-1,6-N-acetylglucosamine synthase-like glycosyltransferase